MGKRLERFGEVWIADDTNGFGLNFVKKTESGILKYNPRRKSSTLKKDRFGTCI